MKQNKSCEIIGLRGKISGSLSKMFCGLALCGVVALGSASTVSARPNRLLPGGQVSQAVMNVLLRPGQSPSVKQGKKAIFTLTLSCRKDGYRPMGIGNKSFGSVRANTHPIKKGNFPMALVNVPKLKKSAGQWCVKYWNANRKRKAFAKSKGTCREAFVSYKATGVCLKVKGTFFGSLIEKRSCTVRGKVRICCDFRKVNNIK